MSFLSRRSGKGEAKAQERRGHGRRNTGPSEMSSSRQLRKRITQPLADPACVDGILSQTRAARGFRSPPEPMTGTYHKSAEFQNVHSVSVRKAGNPLRPATACRDSPSPERSGALAGLWREILLELAGLALVLLPVGRGRALHGDVRPHLGVLGVDLQPLAVGFVLGVRLDGVDRAFRFADAAVDALVRRDDQEVLAFVEAVHRTHLDAVHELTFHAGVGDDVGHYRRMFTRRRGDGRDMAAAAPTVNSRRGGEIAQRPLHPGPSRLSVTISVTDMEEIPMRSIPRLALAGLLSAGLLAGGAVAQQSLTRTPAEVQAGAYKLDPDHGKITGSVDHLGFSTYVGQFVNVQADLTLDPANPANSQLTATIPLTEVDSNSDGLDAHLQTPDFFDTANHPVATFVSRSVTVDADH